MTPPLDLAAIRARLEQATPGPWQVVSEDGEPWEVVPVSGQSVQCACQGCKDWPRTYGNILETDSHVYGPTLQDAEFIAHAPEDIRALLAEVDRLTLCVSEGEQAKAEPQAFDVAKNYLAVFGDLASRVADSEAQLQTAQQEIATLKEQRARDLADCVEGITRANEGAATVFRAMIELKDLSGYQSDAPDPEYRSLFGAIRARLQECNQQQQEIARLREALDGDKLLAHCMAMRSGWQRRYVSLEAQYNERLAEGTMYETLSQHFSSSMDVLDSCISDLDDALPARAALTGGPA